MKNFFKKLKPQPFFAEVTQIYNGVKIEEDAVHSGLLKTFDSSFQNYVQQEPAETQPGLRGIRDAGMKQLLATQEGAVASARGIEKVDEMNSLYERRQQIIKDFADINALYQKANGEVSKLRGQVAQLKAAHKTVDLQKVEQQLQIAEGRLRATEESFNTIKAQKTESDEQYQHQLVETVIGMVSTMIEAHERTANLLNEIAEEFETATSQLEFPEDPAIGSYREYLNEVLSREGLA